MKDHEIVFELLEIIFSNPPGDQLKAKLKDGTSFSFNPVYAFHPNVKNGVYRVWEARHSRTTIASLNPKSRVAVLRQRDGLDPKAKKFTSEFATACESFGISVTTSKKKGAPQAPP
jgi:hypothetical protein